VHGFPQKRMTKKKKGMIAGAVAESLSSPSSLAPLSEPVVAQDSKSSSPATDSSASKDKCQEPSTSSLIICRNKYAMDAWLTR
jgi:hypothetical protein